MAFRAAASRPDGLSAAVSFHGGCEDVGFGEHGEREQRSLAAAPSL
jgi:hypothetical protein